MNEIITIENNLSKIKIGKINDVLERLIDDRHTVMVTDKKVHQLYKKFFENHNVIIIEDGEQNKNLKSVEQIYSELMTIRADKDSLLIGVGGGIVTDITGFVATTYMRGMQFGFIPTTLLSQVDAAIGGKNGINYEGYKNIVGTFNQPEFIAIDTSFLSTLSPRDIRSGMIEAFKCGIIQSSQLYTIFKENTFMEIAENKELLMDMIGRTIKAKLKIVSIDVNDKGKRKLLNLGHTIGHAIERSCDKYNHGEAVSIGISMISEISVKLGYLKPEIQAEIDKILEDNGMPTRTDLPIELIFNALKLDKKKSAGSINIVTIKDIGCCELNKMSFDNFATTLDIKL